MSDRAIEKLLVRLPHCATAHTRLHLAQLRFARRGRYRLLSGWTEEQLWGKQRRRRFGRGDVTCFSPVVLACGVDREGVA